MTYADHQVFEQVFKRVLFEAMDMYLPLIYVTASLRGGQRDTSIKSYMMSMYLSDELRSVLKQHRSIHR